MLRKPIGRYDVSICRIDTDRFGDDGRKLSIQIFHPSSGGSVLHPYMDANFQKQAYRRLPSDNGVNTFCFADGQLISDRDRFPVVIYSHGLRGYQMDSTVLCADIASEGYIVMSVGHPSGSGAITYCDGSAVLAPEEIRYSKSGLNQLGQQWIEDILFAIDCVYNLEHGRVNSMFGGRLDIAGGVHLMGVSFGGCCSAAAALRDGRAIDAVNLDGGIFVELDASFANKPILVLCSTMNYKAHRKLFAVGCTGVTVKKFRKISHWEFSDGVYLGRKGQNDREWADSISVARSRMCLDFFRSNV